MAARELDDHHRGVDRGALPRAAEQQPRNHHDDAECGQIDEDGDAEQPRFGLKQSMHLRRRAEQRRAIAGREEDRQVDADAAEQGVEVVAPLIATATLPTAYSRIRSP
jgi:hypothetical protein